MDVERLPRYILHQQLGAGGMGVVHLGTLVSLAGERRVAIKQLAAHGSIDDRARARLIAEARLVFRLTHTNICQVLDIGENERGRFVVMELVPGLDLRALLLELRLAGQRLDVASAVYIARELARGLDYAHRRTDDAGAPLALVHGDVTPQNTLLSVEGEVKLTDFGIARALGTTAPGAGLRGGTPGYVAPECAHGGGDHRADIYALGVTMLVALLGESAVDALGRLGQLQTLRPDVSAELAAIIGRAVAPAPSARFLSAAALERDLSLELSRRFPAFTPSQLAEVVRECRDRASVDYTPAVGSETLTSLTLSGTSTAADDTVAAAAPAPGATAAPRTSAATPARTKTETAALPRRRAPTAGLLLALALVGGAIAARALRRPHVSTPPLATARPSDPSTTELPAPPSSLTASAPAPAAPTAPAARPSELPSRPHAPSGARHATSHPPRRAGVADGDAYLTVNATPWGAVYVDGRPIADETPVYRRRVAPGDHVVVIHYPDGNASPPQRVHVAAGETRALGFTR